MKPLNTMINTIIKTIILKMNPFTWCRKRPIVLFTPDEKDVFNDLIAGFNDQIALSESVRVRGSVEPQYHKDEMDRMDKNKPFVFNRIKVK